MVRISSKRARQTLLPYARVRIEWVWPKTDETKVLLSQSFSFDRDAHTWLDVTEGFLKSVGEEMPEELRQKWAEAQETVKKEHRETWEHLVLLFPSQMQGG